MLHDPLSVLCNSQMACKFPQFQISVIYVKAEASSIMSSFMIYNPCQISNNYRDQKKEDG